MKNRIGFIVLGIVCVGLGIGLIVLNNNATKRQQEDAAAIGSLSNTLTKVEGSYQESTNTIKALETDVRERSQQLETVSNSLTKVSANLTQASAQLTQTSNELVKTETTLKTTQEEVAVAKTRISELEAQNQALDKQAQDLNAKIGTLNDQIALTQKKLAVAEGDKSFLEKELKQMMSEKADLERQFNDINSVRTQLAKLRDQMYIARRVEWARQGLTADSDAKGAQKLLRPINGSQTTMQAKADRPKYDLNVEVRQDGSVKVIPPLTNSAPAKGAPK
jgi:chromosome segregation ATPase